MADTKLGGSCPRDVREWDVQCGRCGSSMRFEHCDGCVDGFQGHDCGEDSCACAEPADNVTCGICGGAGGFHICLSSEAFCKAHPREGRGLVERSTPEWFVVGEREVANG